MGMQVDMTAQFSSINIIIADDDSYDMHTYEFPLANLRHSHRVTRWQKQTGIGETKLTFDGR